MRVDPPLNGTRVGYNIVVVTLDQHAAGPAARVAPRLTKDFPGLTISIHAAAEWAENPASLARCKEALKTADIVGVGTVLGPISLSGRTQLTHFHLSFQNMVK